jgi:hypothetical protein
MHPLGWLPNLTINVHPLKMMGDKEGEVSVVGMRVHILLGHF